MAKFRLSRRAKVDLMDIEIYTLATWGEGQAISYFALGRSCEYLRQGLRRMECGSHVIFYRHGPSGIVVSRILHQRMLPDGHLM